MHLNKQQAFELREKEYKQLRTQNNEKLFELYSDDDGHCDFDYAGNLELFKNIVTFEGTEPITIEELNKLDIGQQIRRTDPNDDDFGFYIVRVV